jgi:hypothetical protein
LIIEVHDPIRLVAQSYPKIAAELLTPLLDLLQLSRESCGGDIDKFLVVLVVALRSARHPDFRACSPEQLISGEVPVFPGFGTNARSIAASLGIPKETIRRKVAELIGDGWIVRIRARLYVTAAGHRQLTPVRGHIARLAVANYEVVSGLLAKHED